MRTRIAGVSPSANDLEKPTLTMVEIPLSSPAIGVASCALSGHLASLSAESIVNIFSFRVKDASGRGKMQYHDFDRLCAVELPERVENLSFLGNFISCHGPSKVSVFRLCKSDKTWSPSAITCVDKFGVVNSRSQKSMNLRRRNKYETQSKFGKEKEAGIDQSNKVSYDPTDESVTVHLPTILRANRKRAGNTVLIEEFCSEILHKSRIIYSSSAAVISVEDILRLTFPTFNLGTNPNLQEKFFKTELYPVRIHGKNPVFLFEGRFCTKNMYSFPCNSCKLSI